MRLGEALGLQAGEQALADRHELGVGGTEVFAQLETRRIERVLVTGDLLDEIRRKEEQQDDVFASVLKSFRLAERRESDITGAHMPDARFPVAGVQQIDVARDVNADDVFADRHDDVDRVEVMQLDDDAVPTPRLARQQQSGWNPGDAGFRDAACAGMRVHDHCGRDGERDGATHSVELRRAMPGLRTCAVRR